MPAIDSTAGCQCIVSMATDFVQNLLCCGAFTVFSFLPSSAHTRNSSQLTQGTVIEAAEGFLELLFLWRKLILNCRHRERERTGDQQGETERSDRTKGRRLPVCMTQWKMCLSEYGCSEATEVLPGASSSPFFNSHLPHNGPIV